MSREMASTDMVLVVFSPCWGGGGWGGAGWPGQEQVMAGKGFAIIKVPGG